MDTTELLKLAKQHEMRGIAKARIGNLIDEAAHNLTIAYHLRIIAERENASQRIREQCEQFRREHALRKSLDVRHP